MHSDARAPAIRRVTRSDISTRRRSRCQHGAPKFAMLLLLHVAQVSFAFQLPAQCRASQCREPLLYAPRSFLLRTTAVQCTEPYVPYVPSREPYVPSWSQGGSAKKNVYAEQQTEYEEYAKALQGRADESEDSRDSPLAPPSLEAIEGALRAALAPVRLRCGEQDPFGRPSPPASPCQASWPRRADPRSCLRPRLWRSLCRSVVGDVFLIGDVYHIGAPPGCHGRHGRARGAGQGGRPRPPRRRTRGPHPRRSRPVSEQGCDE